MMNERTAFRGRYRRCESESERRRAFGGEERRRAGPELMPIAGETPEQAPIRDGEDESWTRTAILQRMFEPAFDRDWCAFVTPLVSGTSASRTTFLLVSGRLAAGAVTEWRKTSALARPTVTNGRAGRVGRHYRGSCITPNIAVMMTRGSEGKVTAGCESREPPAATMPTTAFG